MLASLSVLLLGLAQVPPTFSQSQAGTFTDAGNTLVSAMMLFLGNQDRLYIMDKAEGNPTQINGHPAWASTWEIASGKYTTMEIRTNIFCASGMHLPNGSWVTFGGYGAVGPGSKIGSVPNNQGSADFDDTYKDFDGARSIRILNPCTSSDNLADPKCQWFDDPKILSMQKKRWYSAAEPLADGTIVLIGGFVNGGYINRNFPNTDPKYEGNASEPTYEFFPSRGPAQDMQFMATTSGLNAYAHTFLMASGKMFVQANTSTILWNYNTNVETSLPDMPGKVARVYPASGATAMLPLTPANNWTPTILFCGGSDMPSDAYGNYSHPFVDTWNFPASRDCQRITPEPQDGSAPQYVKDDEMIDRRTMGQFIALPDGKYLVINGGQNGTAGYANQTGKTPGDQMPFGMSLATGPVLTPSLYDPNAPAGKRWSSAGLSASRIPRLYHSSAMLLPDASVFVAGSNPNADVNTTTPFPTTYAAEIFYPPYFSATTRPVPKGVPKTLSYGGGPFDITIPASSYSGSANDAADKTMIVLIRGGFTTHAMSMGQRFMQLNNTHTVMSSGWIVFHVAQLPPNPNLFQPGPALLFVTIKGVPSVGTHLIVGNGQVGTQPTAPASSLPPSVRLGSASGSAAGLGQSGGRSMTAITVGIIIVAVITGLSLLGAVFAVCISRRRRAAAKGLPPLSSGGTTMTQDGYRVSGVPRRYGGNGGRYGAGAGYGFSAARRAGMGYYPYGGPPPRAMGRRY